MVHHMPKLNNRTVVIITDYWKNSHGGGVSSFLKGLTTEYEKGGVDSRVIYRKGEDPANYRIQGSKYLFPLRALFVLQGIAPSVVHSQGTWFCLLPGYLWKRVHGARLVHTAHTVVQSPSLVEKVLMRFLLKRCDVVSFLSNYLRTRYEQAYGLEQGKGIKVDPGVTSQNITDNEVQRFRSDYEIDEKQIMVLGQGLTASAVKYEGAKRLIMALKLVVPSHPEALLVLSRDGPYVPALRKHATEQGVSSKVLFVGDLSDPLVAVRACDIFAHITMDEGLGLAVLEAMSQGTPIVASNVGGIPELIDGQNGRLVGDDPMEIAAAIDFFILHPAIAREMGERARAEVLKRYDWSRTASIYMSLYFPDGAISSFQTSTSNVGGRRVR